MGSDGGRTDGQDTEATQESGEIQGVYMPMEIPPRSGTFVISAVPEMITLPSVRTSKALVRTELLPFPTTKSAALSGV